MNITNNIEYNLLKDAESDANSVPLFYKEHSLITAEDYNKGFVACKRNFYANQNVPDCSNFLQLVSSSLNHLNPYYIYDS